MSIQEFASFLSRIHPLDTLSRGDLENLSKSISIKTIQKNECIFFWTSHLEHKSCVHFCYSRTVF